MPHPSRFGKGTGKEQNKVAGARHSRKRDGTRGGKREQGDFAKPRKKRRAVR